MLAYHYDAANAQGSPYFVLGSDCAGGGVSFGAGEWWADRISSVRHHGCSAVKHWTGAGNTGASQTTEGGIGAVRNLNGTLNNSVRSIQYLGTVN